MKFKILFIVFVGLIIFSSLVLLFLPFGVLGSDYAFSFWSSNWYLLLLLAVLLIVLVVFYTKNRRMFSYLEEENWDNLLVLLYDSIINKNKLKYDDIKLFILLSVLKNRFDYISELSLLLSHKPVLKDAFCIELGLPYIKSQDPDIIIPYYKDITVKQKGRLRDWAGWFYIYGILLTGDYTLAKQELLSLLSYARESIVVLLALYNLNAFSGTDKEIADFVSKHKKSFKEDVKKEKIFKLIEKEKADIYVLMMSGLIQDSVEWIFA
ncbi:hypothetical protein WKV44_09970 [Spirochaetia bacterium 38H-sp]|uniref:Uncharacterized protein n=1 Tax=Rarispira pelagica TaxID=3141764 RepID=A0ABU9UDW7_9SPIR